MLGHGLAPIEHDVLALHERHLVRAEQSERAPGAQRGQPGLDGFRVDGVGRIAHQPQHHALVGAVALAGGAERAVQLHAHATHAGQQAVPLEPVREHQGRTHGPHGMRAGGPDTYLEQIENADSHGELR
ncbi:hypothetical protein D3C81_1579900 [compost metagenome]